MSKDEVSLILKTQELDKEDWNPMDGRWLLNGMYIVFKDEKCPEITIGELNFLQK